MRVTKRTETNVMIQMMRFVAFIKNISHHFRWPRVDNGGRYYVRHISMIFIFWNL